MNTKKKPESLKSRKPLSARKPLVAKTPLKKSASPKKQTTPTITKLKKNADRYFSLATRYRFADYVNGEWVAECVTCSTTKPIKQLQCGHFMSRRFNATRFSEENTAPQCYGCNVMQQGQQFKYSKWIDRFYGDGTADKLLLEAAEAHQFTADELREIIADSKAQIKFYENSIKGK